MTLKKHIKDLVVANILTPGSRDLSPDSRDPLVLTVGGPPSPILLRHCIEQRSTHACQGRGGYVMGAPPASQASSNQEEVRVDTLDHVRPRRTTPSSPR